MVEVRFKYRSKVIRKRKSNSKRNKVMSTIGNCPIYRCRKWRVGEAFQLRYVRAECRICGAVVNVSERTQGVGIGMRVFRVNNITNAIVGE